MEFTDTFYTAKGTPSPTVQWSELENAAEDVLCIPEVQAGCLSAFLADQKRKPGANRKENLKEIHSMLHPVQLQHRVVQDILKTLLPQNGSMTTMGTMKVRIANDIPRCDAALATECVQRLVLSQVLKDMPPRGASLAVAISINGADAWLVGRGEFFNVLNKWPPLQPPARPTSYALVAIPAAPIVPPIAPAAPPIAPAAPPIAPAAPPIAPAAPPIAPATAPPIAPAAPPIALVPRVALASKKKKRKKQNSTAVNVVLHGDSKQLPPSKRGRKRRMPSKFSSGKE